MKRGKFLPFPEEKLGSLTGLQIDLDLKLLNKKVLIKLLSIKHVGV